MSKTRAAQPLFDLCGGHPALDFVNSLDDRFVDGGPLELVADYDDLLRFTEQAHLLEPARVRRLANSVNPAAAVRALRSARELREAMAAALYASVDGQAPSPTDIRTLERHFHDASAHRELRWQHPAQSSNNRAVIGWDWGRADADLPVWALSQSAAQLMTSETMDRVRACGADTCRWLFLDTSKNHTRRWCNMKVCGNRMKARRFQARREE